MGKEQELKSLKKSFLITIALVVILAVIGAYVYFTSSPSAGESVKINFIQPLNCPEDVCNTDRIRTWVTDIGIDLGIYNSISVSSPSAFVLRDNTAYFINTASKKAFASDLCVLVNHSNACKIFADSIQKTDAVTLNVFTSLFSVGDVQLKVMAINLKQLLGDVLNVIPRFIIFTDLSNPNMQMETAELKEVERQLCIIDGQQNKWVAYASCIDTYLLNNLWTNTTWQLCAQNVGVDENAMDSCVSERGLALAQREFGAVKQLGLTKTPVLFINNDAYTSQFTFDAIKKTVCLYYKEKPAGC